MELDCRWYKEFTMSYYPDFDDFDTNLFHFILPAAGGIILLCIGAVFCWRLQKSQRCRRFFPCLGRDSSSRTTRVEQSTTNLPRYSERQGRHDRQGGQTASAVGVRYYQPVNPLFSQQVIWRL